MAGALSRAGIVWMREQWVGPYRVDFYLPNQNAVVEVDGTYWHKSRRDRDARKDKFLRGCGMAVWRFEEDAVVQNADRCVMYVLTHRAA